MKKLNGVDWIVLILVIIGSLNWGLVGFFDFNLIHELFHTVPVIANIVYALVGLCGIYLIVKLVLRNK